MFTIFKGPRIPHSGCLIFVANIQPVIYFEALWNGLLISSQGSLRKSSPVTHSPADSLTNSVSFQKIAEWPQWKAFHFCMSISIPGLLKAFIAHWGLISQVYSAYASVKFSHYIFNYKGHRWHLVFFKLYLTQILKFFKMHMKKGYA